MSKRASQSSYAPPRLEFLVWSATHGSWLSTNPAASAARFAEASTPQVVLDDTSAPSCSNVSCNGENVGWRRGHVPSGLDFDGVRRSTSQAARLSASVGEAGNVEGLGFAWARGFCVDTLRSDSRMGCGFFSVMVVDENKECVYLV
ncbi:hypothetical protein GQ53DRAFT_775449 [Thozetella sp. PMI_491]|nr:hypothetical protein GQ53DRAFT_775449 [Thozetella sp. PMI_491]